MHSAENQVYCKKNDQLLQDNSKSRLFPYTKSIMSDHNACLCLSGRDELFLIDLRQVLYFEADDHYANVYYANGTHFLVPHGLSYIDKKLSESVQANLQSVRGDLQSPHPSLAMMRLGRKYIVCLNRIFKVSTVKEQLHLCDDNGYTVVLHIPKAVLRTLIEQLLEEPTA